LFAEIAPFLIPQFDALLLSLLVLAGFLVAVGIIYVLHGFTKAVIGGIAGLISHIPGVGSIIASPVNAVYHWMNAEFAAAEAGLDRRISNYFHQLAKLVRWVGQEIEAHANLLYTLSTILLGSGLTAAIRAALALLHTQVNAVSASFTHLYRAFIRPIYGELHALERWTYPRVKALDHAIDVTIPRDIAGLRARTKALEDRASSALAELTKLNGLLGIAAMTGLIAAVISRLGIGWTRCDNAGKLGKSVCGMHPNLLESLIAGALVVASPISIVDLAKACQAFEGDVEDGIKWFVRELS